MASSFNDLLDILGLPLIAGGLALITHIPLGLQVLQRGVVFMDLAVAQIAALGVLLTSISQEGSTTSLMHGSMAALTGTALVAWLVRRWPAHREALIGLVYVAAAAGAIIILSDDAHGSQKLRAVIAGDVLWVQSDSLGPLLLVSLIVLLIAARCPALLQRDTVFYPLFALVVSLSVPLLGIYLVFATLIAPALPVLKMQIAGLQRQAVLAGGIGLVGFSTGLFLSFWADKPSGPCIVLALVVCSTLAALIFATLKSR